MLSIILLRTEAGNLIESNTTEYGSLYLNYKHITTIDYIPPKLTTVQRIYLNHNRIATLSGIEAFENIKVLHLKFNCITHFEELYKIKNPFFMQSIALTGNPLQSDKRCREDGLKNIFKNLKQYNPSYKREEQFRENYKQQNKRANFNLNTYNLERSINKNYNKRQERVKQVIQSPGAADRTFSFESERKPKSSMIARQNQNSPMIATKRFRQLFDQSTKKGSNYSSHSLKPSIQQSSRFHVQIPQFISPLKSQPVTAKFKNQYSLNQNSELTIDFIDQQNEYLAEAYYIRCLAQKSWQAMTQVLLIKGDQFNKSRLILKAWMSLKASVSLRKVQRQYQLKRKHISQTILNSNIKDGYY